jgi:hypothetical protein
MLSQSEQYVGLQIELGPEIELGPMVQLIITTEPLGKYFTPENFNHDQIRKFP